MGPGILGMQFNGGTLETVAPNASREEQVRVINDIIARLNDLLKTQTFTDGKNKRYINGYLAGGWPGGDFGVKLTAPGYDVTDPNAVLLYSWDYTTNQQITYTNGVPVVLVGNSPLDNEGGVWAVAPGYNVIDELNAG